MSCTRFDVVRFPSLKACGQTCALLVIVLLLSPLQAEAQQVFDHQPASELLQDGLDAIADGSDDLARETFGYLIRMHPNSREADHARKALQKLGRAAAPSVGEEQAGWSTTLSHDASRIAELRHYFLHDVGDRVFFAQSSAELGGRARIVIDAQAAWLKHRDDVLVTIVGRADDGGSDASALALSQKRAEAVRARMIEAGLPATRIAIESRGRSDPVAICKSATCQAQNRQAETLLSDPRSAASAGLEGVDVPASSTFAPDRDPNER